MKLVALTPTEVVLDTEVVKVIAEGAHGSFAVLPRHRDIVALLLPGLLSVVSPGGRETFCAADEGWLMKTGAEVRVISWKILVAGDLGAVRDAVERDFRERSLRERRARLALARLEAEFVQRFGALQRGGGA